jgi:hypothetical protein
MLASQLATAAIVRWNLQNVTFDDGATGSGFLLWDADAGSEKWLVNWDITIEGGTSGSPPFGLPAPFRFEPSNSVPFDVGITTFILEGPER